MRWLLLFFLLSSTANALTVSPRSLRIEDSREGNVLLGAEEARVEKGELFKTILLLWGNLDISGEVDKVIVLKGHVTFHAGSKLTSSLVVMGGSFDAESGADVAADKVTMELPGPAWRFLQFAGNLWRENVDWVSKACASIVTCLILWLIGWPLFAFFPRLQAATEGALIPNWPKNLAVGLLGSIGSCVVFVLLIISIIGIVLVPIYFLLLLFAGLTSYLAAGLWAGHRLLPPKKGKKIQPGGFFLGLLALQFLWAVPVWWAALPVILLWILGWGALVRATAKLWK
jgi:hypothetical protein